MIKGVENTEAKKVLLENVIFRKLTLQRAAQTSYRPRADSGLYGFCVQTETMTVSKSLLDILFILELPFFKPESFAVPECGGCILPSVYPSSPAAQDIGSIGKAK